MYNTIKQYKKEIKLAIFALSVIILVGFVTRLYYVNSTIKQDQYINQQVLLLTELKIKNSKESAEIEKERLKLNERIEKHNKEVARESELGICVDNNIEARVENKDIILCK